MPRPCKCRRVEKFPHAVFYKPAGVPLTELDERCLSVEGLEALRLADGEGLSMEEAALRMGISRHTFGRLLRTARRTVADVLAKGIALRIDGGHYSLKSGNGDGAELRNNFTTDSKGD